jgi:hypothetical protein
MDQWLVALACVDQASQVSVACRWIVTHAASLSVPDRESPITWARQRVAEIAGLRVEAVKLDLKLEY